MVLAMLRYGRDNQEKAAGLLFVDPDTTSADFMEAARSRTSLFMPVNHSAGPGLAYSGFQSCLAGLAYIQQQP